MNASVAYRVHVALMMHHFSTCWMTRTLLPSTFVLVFYCFAAIDVLAQVRSGPANPAGYEDRCLPGNIPFSEPKVVRSENGLLEMVLFVDIFRYEGAYSFTTRLYNGTFPGPTLAVMPGDKISILLINNLGGDQAIDDWDAYTFHSPNTTSLHLHGLHIDPKNNSDFIFEGVGPGKSKLYQYSVPEDHYPGAHWYHAHYHGSTAFHVMGGLAGALIVDNPEGWLPEEYASLVWHTAVLQVIRADAAKAGFLATSYEIGNLVNPDFDQCEFQYSTSDSIYVVNGIYQPKVSMEVGEYRVFRLVHAIADVFALEIVMSDQEACSIWTLSKDGVYFDKAVKEHVVFLWSGNRADVLIMCSEPGNYTLLSNGTSQDNDWFFYIDTMKTRTSTNLIYFNIEPSSIERQDVAFDQVAFPPKPSYLQDLVNINASDIAGVLDLQGDFTLLSINGNRFSGATNYSYFLDYGKIYEFNLLSDNYTHPMHLHVNHFQIVNISLYREIGNYNEQWEYEHSQFLWNVGEWRDTVPIVAGYRITVRFRTDAWWGPMIYHCHYLPHADRGMMTVMYINPPEEDEVDRLGDLSPNTNRSYVDGNFNAENNDDATDYQSDEFLDLGEFKFDLEDSLDYQESHNTESPEQSEQPVPYATTETLFDDETLLEDNN
jgi:FtsP/CotA-like multicopper oxidase with cupredoxin domain